MNRIQTTDFLNKIKKYKDRQPIYPLDGKQIINYQRLTWDLFNYYKTEDYIINEENEKIIKTILPYFIKLPDFNKYGVIKNESDLNKGLLIWGDLGVGKTFLFDILADISNYLYQKFGIKDFCFPRRSAISIVNNFMNSVKNNDRTFDLENYKHNRLYIDDLGNEKKAFKDHELMADLLFERNRNKALTFVTTNMSPNEIAKRYGLRIGDRLAEMFNIIKWEGESLRQ